MSDFENRDNHEEMNENFIEAEVIEQKPQNDDNKNNKGNKKAIASTVAIALTASLLGGGVGGLGVYSAMKDSTDDVSIEKEHDTQTTGSPTEFKQSGKLTTAEAVEMVSPAVVGVSTKSIVVDNFFNAPTEQEGIGSGFIISEDGLVVTNYHVVKGAQEVKVILSGGEEVNAKVVNFDEKADLAVVEITDDIKMPGVAKLGDSSKLKSGEDVIAIGNPLGKEFSETVTKGIISSPNRELSVNGNPEDVETFIQTDAAINPGNSGGPLINTSGEVIGVNTAKKVGEEIEGIGFSIPINTVKEKLDALSKPILVIGINGQNVTEEMAKQYNLPVGVRVKSTVDFSPAEKAGLKPGDVITAYNGKPIKNINDLNDLKTGSNEGETIELTVFRNGKDIKVPLVLESH